MEHITTFIDGASYDTYENTNEKKSTDNPKFNSFVKYMYEQPLHIGSHNMTKGDLTNYDFLLFVFFNQLIKKSPERIMLSDKLENISRENEGGKMFVMLYACQGNKETCIVDDCYKRIHGINGDTKFMTGFRNDMDTFKKPGVEIINHPPQLSIDIKSDDSTEREIISKMDRDLIDVFIDFSTFNIFVNLFYDIVNNTSEFLKKISKLMRYNRIIIASIQLKHYYGSNHIILLSLIDNSAYYSSFHSLFKEFIQILQANIKGKITVGKFIHGLITSIPEESKLYDKIIKEYTEHHSFIIPTDLNNQNQLEKLFTTISFNPEQKKALCSNPGGFLTANPSFIKDINILIMSSYTGQPIPSLNNLNVLVKVGDFMHLKIKYIEHLIKRFGCKKLI